MNYIEPSTKVLRWPEDLVAIKRGRVAWPRSVEVDLSERCNLLCKHCDFAHFHSDAVMTRELGELVMQACAEAGVRAITLTGGGEPTMCPDWKPIVHAARALGIAVGMYTNGLQPLGAAAAMFSWVYFSLDATTASEYRQRKGSNGFHKVLANATAAAELTTVGIGMLVDGENAKLLTLMRLEELARQTNAAYADLRPIVGLTDYSWVTDFLAALQGVGSRMFSRLTFRAERFEQMLHYERSYTECRASALAPCISADGTVWVCPNTRGLRQLGRITERGSLRHIWQERKPQYVAADCRAACRNHALNETLEYVCSEGVHAEFI